MVEGVVLVRFDLGIIDPGTIGRIQISNGNLPLVHFDDGM
jgi:hypothetical protein